MDLKDLHAKIGQLTLENDFLESALSVGDIVGFIDRSGSEQHGRAVRLNQKTATIESENQGWRVSYELLHKVIDIDMD